MNTRVVICTVAGLLAVFLVVLCTPRPIYTPQGIILPAATVRAPISPDQVVIQQEAVNGRFTRLGEIRVEMHFRALDEHARDALFQKIQSLAATVGANTVVVKFLVPGDMVGHVLTFVGTAGYVPHALPRSVAR